MHEVGLSAIPTLGYILKWGVEASNALVPSDSVPLVASAFFRPQAGDQLCQLNRCARLSPCLRCACNHVLARNKVRSPYTQCQEQQLWCLVKSGKATKSFFDTSFRRIRDFFGN
jgi:hypothetical protein